MREVVVVILISVVVQPDPQQPVSFGKLNKDFRGINTIRWVKMTPNLTNSVRHGDTEELLSVKEGLTSISPAPSNLSLPSVL